MRSVLVALALALAPAAVAQPPQAQPVAPQPPRQPDAAAQAAAIDKLSWLVGAWEGSGWVEMGGPRQTFRQTEQVETRLGGLLLAIEGRGYAGSPERPVFSAFAVVSYDDAARKYAFRSYTRGYATTASAEVREDGALVWTMAPPGQVIRYTITQPQPGAWHEIGERSTDGGASFRQFFEMNLTRKP